VAELAPTMSGQVGPEHIDGNGHMNIVHYLYYLAHSTGRLLAQVGLDDGYRADGGATVFTAEQHITYHTEQRLGDTFTAHPRLLARSGKALHLMAFLLARDGVELAATLEVVFVHVSMRTRAPEPIPAAMATDLETVLERHRALSWAAPSTGWMWTP
jgi:acyl-CoA thioester hydrolase